MSHRPTLIFWLLLAATVSVTAVAEVWMLNTEGLAEPYERGISFALGLFVGEIGVLAAWAVVAKTSLWLRMLALLALPAFLALMLTVADETSDPSQYWTYLALFEVQTALQAAVGWFSLRFLPPVLRRQGVEEQGWSFSLLQLFGVTTVVCLLAWLIQRAGQDEKDWPLIAAFLANNALLTAIALIAFKLFVDRRTRIVHIFGGAVLLGLIWNLGTRFNIDFNWMVLNVSQAVVLWTWLTCAPLIEPKSSDEATQYVGALPQARVSDESPTMQTGDLRKSVSRQY